MIINGDPYAVTGVDRAAVSVRLLLAGPVVWMSGLRVCPQHDASFAGTPAFRTVRGRLRNASVARPTVKINTVEFQPVLGSSDWREPV